MSVFGKRLKAARLQAALSQERLGIEAGLDPASASARMNRYELGRRNPDAELVEKIGAVLDLPAAYFYAVDDLEAELLIRFHKLPKAHRQKALQILVDLGQKR